MSKVRIGIIGVGGMGRHHAKYLAAGQVEGAELAAICDIEPDALKATKQICREDVKSFETAEALFAAKCVDAVVIATPHYDHPPLAIQAFESGLHVLSEKPAGVYTKQVREMNEAADAHAGRMFALMFQQRTVPMHQKLKELLEGGEVEIQASYPAGVIGDTPANLAAAAAGENLEWTKLYKEAEETARKEGFTEVAEQFKEIAEVEEEHEKRYRKLLANLKGGKVFKRDQAVKWKCRNCGYVHEGKEAPDVCPACAHPQAYYELLCENY